MWWGSGPPMWGFWFIFPVMGFIFMLIMMFLMIQFLRGRGGIICGFKRDDGDVGALRKEIRELRKEIEELRKNKGV